MTENVEPRPLPDPINDEGLERWKVQYQYRASVVLDHILLSDFGALIARIERAEKDRDQARRAVCHEVVKHPALKETVREACRCLYGNSEADRLFPPEVPT